MKKFITFVLSFIVAITSIVCGNLLLSKDVVNASAETISEVDVYFIAGQSNASGSTRAYRTAFDTTIKDFAYNFSYDITDERIAKYNTGFNNVMYYGRANFNTFTDLSPVKLGLGYDNVHIGPELGLAEILDPLYEGTNKKAVIIKFALGGSSIIGIPGSNSGNWCAPSYKEKYDVSITGEDLYSSFVGTSANDYSDGFIWDAFNKINNKGYSKINLKGLLWAQGEAECNASMHTKHQEGFECFIKDFRRDVTNIADLVENANDGCAITDPTNLEFLIAEVCPSNCGATEMLNGTSSSTYVNSVIAQQRKIAENDPNVVTMSTAGYIIEPNTVGMGSLDRTESYTEDEWHYNADDMVDIGNRAAIIMYSFYNDENLTELAKGFWVKINGQTAIRLSTTNTTDVFNLKGFTVTVDKTFTDDAITSVSVSVDIGEKYEIKEVTYQLGKTGNESTDNRLYADGSSVIVPDILISKLSQYNTIFVNLNISYKAIQTVNIEPSLQKVVLSENILGNYQVGEVVRFKVYLSSFDYEGYVLSQVSYNGTALTADADGYFSFTVDAKEIQSLIVNATTANFAGKTYADYDLVVDPSIDAPTTGGEQEDAPSTDNDSSTIGSSCALSTESECVYALIFALVGLCFIVYKKKITAK